MRVALLSTYELGHQPFAVASAAAWLRDAGFTVSCVDTSIEGFDASAFRNAELIGFSLPMHTATRIAAPLIAEIRSATPQAHLCCFGLYAPLNEAFLRELGVESVLGGEFEGELVRLAQELRDGQRPQASTTSFDRLQFKLPDRELLPVLASYPKLRVESKSRIAGYTEASRGCKHLCRHCPVVPVYQGRFRVVQPEVVLADVRQQVAQGAQHITFGDPDFFNGPTHARRIVEALHAEFPRLTYDATIKVEHLLRHRDLLPVLRETGCLLVVSAVESLQDEVLAKLDKGHTRADFLQAIALCRAEGLTLSPTFIPFTPWTSLDSYRDLLATLRDLDLMEAVGPVQLALRLLIPAGSRLLELDDIQRVMTGFDKAALLYRWKHDDPSVDVLAHEALRAVHRGQKRNASRSEIFGDLWALAFGEEMPHEEVRTSRSAVPYLEEPWYC
jgi:radical SAM superfamily enzyme YgiQ (UPF0313 family)